MAIELVILKLPAVEFLTNFSCFLVLTFEIKMLLGWLSPFWKALMKIQTPQNVFDIQHVNQI